MRVLSLDGQNLVEAQKVSVSATLGRKHFYLVATIVSASVGLADIHLAEYDREQDVMEEMEKLCAFFEANPNGLYRVGA